MAFKDVTTGAIDIKVFPDEPFEGYYIGSKEIETKIGSQVIYKFQKKDGNKKFQIYGFTNLNRAMEMITEGVMCRIVYTGKEKIQTKFGMKDVHQVKVQTDEDDTLELKEHEPEAL